MTPMEQEGFIEAYERLPSTVEEWAMNRPEFLRLLHDNVYVSACFRLAANEDWPVEKFLEKLVIVLANAHTTLTKQYLDYAAANPVYYPIVVPAS